MRGPRNDSYMDIWSLTHFAWGILLGWLMTPIWAMTILILWEPIEIFVLAPLIHKALGKEFGHETLRNSLSDILFDLAGVLAGAYLLTALVAPPLHLG